MSDTQLNTDNTIIDNLDTNPSFISRLKEILMMSFPTIINMSSFAFMQLIDTWMISKLGKGALAAQYGAGSIAFCAVCFFLGLLATTNIFSSQCLGAKRYGDASNYCWQGIWLSLLIGAIITSSIFFSDKIFIFLGHEPSLVKDEVIYYNYVTSAITLLLLSKALGGFFIGIHRPIVVLTAGIIGNVVKLLVGYALILGNFGCPKLGLRGAGISSIIAFSVEALILLSVFLIGPISKKFSTKYELKLDFKKMVKLIKLGACNGLMWINDTGVWIVFFVIIIASFGTDYLAAGCILNRYWQIILMPAIGLGQATTAIVGRYCGAKQTHLAQKQAVLSMFLTLTYTSTVAIVFWLCRDPLVSIFNSSSDPSIQSITTYMFLYMLICQAFEGLCVVSLGALKGAGDILWPSLVQAGLAWIVGVGGSFFMVAHFYNLGASGPWITACMYECGYGLMITIRFFMGKWKKIDLLNK